MELTEDEIMHLERLARVRLSKEARDKLKQQLARIIDFVRKLSEIDTSGYVPRAYVERFECYMRDDFVGSCLSRDTIMAEAPDNEDGLFKVPPVIETDDS